MRLPLRVILVVAVIVILIIVAGIFLVRGFNPASSSSPTADATAQASGASSAFALPASQGMATFTPAPQNREPTALPTAIPPPAETPVPVPATDTQAPPPVDNTQGQATPNTANGTNNAGVAPPPIEVPAGEVVASSNTNIQVTPVPAIPVNGSGGGTSDGGGSADGSGSSGGGAACGTRLIHVVRPGENLFRIGLRYNTTAYAIARLNGITNVRLVSSGRRLVIVACARGSGGGGQYTPRSSTYVVKPGDTLFRIALRFGINTNYLCQVNGLTSNLIVPGQVLVIP